MPFPVGSTQREAQFTSRVLIAWEIGGYYGHFGTELPIALALRDRGFEVLFAAPDAKVAAQVLIPRGFPFVHAPRLYSPAHVNEPPATYAEMLLAEGYGDYDALQGRVMVWLQLLDLWKTKLVVIDHAPTALLAARIANIPPVQVGHGFFIPPIVSPLPCLRTWEPPIQQRRIKRSEALVLHTINRVLERTGTVPPLQALSELFTLGDRILTTFPELDHFPGRVREKYDGAMFGDVGQVRQANLAPEGELVQARGSQTDGSRTLDSRDIKILAYIHDNVPGLTALLDVLAHTNRRALCVVPQMGPKECRRFSTNTLTVSSRLRNLGEILVGLDLVICGGLGTVAQALLAGVPVMLMPANLEQYLLGLRVEAIGAGVCVATDRQPSILAKCLDEVLTCEKYRSAAGTFATRYKGFHPSLVVKRVVELIQRRLAERLS